jgi:hypothetical protein
MTVRTGLGDACFVGVDRLVDLVDVMGERGEQAWHVLDAFDYLPVSPALHIAGRGGSRYVAGGESVWAAQCCWWSSHTRRMARFASWRMQGANVAAHVKESRPLNTAAA